MPHATPPPTPVGDVPIMPSRRPGVHRLVLAAVVLSLVGLVAWPARQALRPVPDVAVSPALPVLTPAADTRNTAAPGRRARAVQAAGWIEPAPYLVAVPALADGIVQTVHVLDGESVVQGQLLVELDAADAQLALQRERAHRDATAASVRAAEAALAAAQTDWDEPVERERAVAVSAAMLTQAQASLDRLPAERREAEADAERWRVEAERLRAARTSGAANANELQVAEAELAGSLARLDALRLDATARAARVEQLDAERSAAARAAALRVAERRALDEATAALALARSSLAAHDAAVAQATLRLDRMTIHAPMTGNVLRRLVGPGDKLLLGMDSPHSAHVVHLYDPASLQVRVDVPLADASQVSVGQRCEIVVDVLPDDTFVGEVTHITHEADLQKNTLEVKVRVLEPSPLLKPEMLARVRFVGHAGVASGDAGGDAAEVTVRVPRAGVADGRVWVVRGRRGLVGRAHEAAVQVIGDADGPLVTVRGELRVGDLVILNPAGLRVGARVRVNDPPDDAVATRRATEGGAA